MIRRLDAHMLRDPRSSAGKVVVVQQHLATTPAAEPVPVTVRSITDQNVKSVINESPKEIRQPKSGLAARRILRSGPKLKCRGAEVSHLRISAQAWPALTPSNNKSYQKEIVFASVA